MTHDLDKLDLVLEVLVGSGLVFLFPETPLDRYQLVHDYLVSFIQQQYKTGLVEELEQEREQRKLVEEKLSIELAQRLQAEEHASHALKQRLLWSRFAIATLTGATLITGVLWVEENAQKQRAETGELNAQLDAMSASSQSLLLANQDLPALTEAVRAAVDSKQDGRVLSATKWKLPQPYSRQFTMCMNATGYRDMALRSMVWPLVPMAKPSPLPVGTTASNSEHHRWQGTQDPQRTWRCGLWCGL